MVIVETNIENGACMNFGGDLHAECERVDDDYVSALRSQGQSFSALHSRVDCAPFSLRDNCNRSHPYFTVEKWNLVVLVLYCLAHYTCVASRR